MKPILISAGVLLVLGYIIWPKVQALDQYGVESAARGGLGTLRLRVDEQKKAGGKPPAELAGAPVLWESTFFRPPHPPTSSVLKMSRSEARDSGGWGYDARTGDVFIDCSHSDSKLSAWSSY